MKLKTSLDAEKSTSLAKSKKIRLETEFNIGHYAALGPEAIEKRLRELDTEWDIERALEANVSALALAGVICGFKDKRFLALPAAAALFLLQHAVDGWSPLIPVMRSLGFRTQREIDRERYALKAVRGDFENLKQIGGMRRQPVNRIYDAVE